MWTVCGAELLEPICDAFLYMSSIRHPLHHSVAYFRVFEKQTRRKRNVAHCLRVRLSTIEPFDQLSRYFVQMLRH
jgi:hypothetical protein